MFQVCAGQSECVIFFALPLEDKSALAKTLLDHLTADPPALKHFYFCINALELLPGVGWSGGKKTTGKAACSLNDVLSLLKSSSLFTNG